jgi:hypothetical protein
MLENDESESEKSIRTATEDKIYTEELNSQEEV